MIKKSKIRKYLRAVHRDLGYLTVGLCLIYGISGFLLNHMDGKDPAYKTTKEQFTFDKQLNKEQLLAQWNAHDLPEVRKISGGSEGVYRLMLNGGIGVYHSSTGELYYEINKRKPVIFYLNKFHYNQVNHWTSVADFFACSLIFLAVSGMFIVPKKNGLMGRGKWFVLIGLIIPILWVVFS
ncbi:MAG: PepSY-associated TM helix domain-containing protein [Mangrovibacterium sp.]